MTPGLPALTSSSLPVKPGGRGGFFSPWKSFWRHETGKLCLGSWTVFSLTRNPKIFNSDKI
jgi:hypothetical protein